MAAKVIVKLLGAFVLLLIFQQGQFSAQTIDESEQETDVITERPLDTEDLSRIPPGRSLNDSVIQNRRNKVGFSLGLYGIYDSRPDYEIEGSTQKTMGMVAPSVFLNLGDRKNEFHVDYSYERRVFADTDLDTSFHTGNIRYEYKPTRKLSFRLWDELRSAPSNLISLTGGFTPNMPNNSTGPGTSAYSYERLFMNQATAGMRYQLTRNTEANVFGSSQVFRYEFDTENNMNPYSAGGSILRKLTRKLDATAEFVYSNYDSISGSRKERTKQLSGGFNYQIHPDWAVQTNAGIQWIEIQGFYYHPAYVEVGISRTTRASQITLSYTKSAQYQLGTPLLAATHSISLMLDQRVTKNSSFYFSNNFYRTKPYIESGNLTTVISGLGIRYALLSNVLGSINGNYLYQDKPFRAQPDSLTLSRYVVYVGIEILVPGVKGR